MFLCYYIYFSIWQFKKIVYALRIANFIFILCQTTSEDIVGTVLLMSKYSRTRRDCPILVPSKYSLLHELLYNFCLPVSMIRNHNVDKNGTTMWIASKTNWERHKTIVFFLDLIAKFSDEENMFVQWKILIKNIKNDGPFFKMAI